MKTIFFLDIDTQRDLMSPSGALYVPGAERLVPRLRRIFDFARKHEIFVISSMDAHTPEDSEFRTYPLHCLQKTEGQLKIEETLLHRPLIIPNKPLDRNILDAVKKHKQIIVEKQAADLFSNPMAEKLVRVLPQRAIVFGVPLESSVMTACLGLQKMGTKTVVLSDAVRPRGAKAGEEAVEEMRGAGVEFITTETLFGIHSG